LVGLFVRLGEDGYEAQRPTQAFEGAGVSPAVGARTIAAPSGCTHPCGERRKGGLFMLIDILVVLAIIAVALYIMRGRFTRT
jgi:hypothetical protein